ncbi:deaminase domain-containing protein [Hirsutella rhossiliensis]|uniref:Deaminase domain-containing protein n=1 Tax=Hirsutella rhossiliensis TaxID=111463 RepID=A0A9P8MPF3_9HYPO|nr:deaminase domain-containing protein [Hirsutella rhossiliensis]KAH0959893.1 deaminase domain-containing protein [Hirsutella rhossiliensis]
MAKTPRLDPYARALARLYEPLILLGILGKDCAPHVTTRYTPGSIVGARRRFLKNLAVICDYTKGGATTTAIAVEEGAANFTFWLATNSDSSAAAAVEFLKGVLASLRAVCDVDGGTGTDADQGAERELMRAYAGFAEKRLKKESKLLFRFATRCREILEADSEDEGSDLATWVRQFEPSHGKNALALCHLAYQSRHDSRARRIERLGADPEDGSTPGGTSLAFRALWHFIGRLASHVRVVKELVGDARRLRALLDDCGAAPVAAPECAAPPRVDALTTLPGILNRMVKASDARRAELQDRLALLDHRVGLEAAVRAKLAGADEADEDAGSDGNNHGGRGQGRLTPHVHAEVQLLDHFHAHSLPFAADDRFVACSKAACFCCRLYFRHHPARCVEPDSHGNLHLNWGVARLRDGARDARWAEQRAVLIRITDDIRDLALERIAVLAGPRPSRPDSLSGITRSSEGAGFSGSDGEALDSGDSDGEQNGNLDGGRSDSRASLGGRAVKPRVRH